MKIKVTNDEELLKMAQEAIHILANLRKATKLWNEHYGATLANKKKYYEQKADEFIEVLQVKDHKYASQIKIEVNGTTDQNAL